MNQLNLKTGEVLFVKKRKGRWLGLIIGSVVLLIAGVVLGYLYLTNDKLKKERDSLKQEVIFQEKSLAQDDFWSVYDFESRLQVIDFLLKEKNQPTKSLLDLSEKTLSETIFKELKISLGKNGIMYECKIVVPSYSFLAKQVEAYRTINRVISVGFDSGSVIEEGVESTIKVILKKENRDIEDKDSGKESV